MTSPKIAGLLGHPQRTMLVAHHLRGQLEAGSPPDTAVAAAITTALAETRDAHRALWDELDRNERIVLTALANGQAPTGIEVASEHRVHVPPCSARSSGSPARNVTATVTTATGRYWTPCSANGSASAERSSA